MKCKICDEELTLPDITCNLCCNSFDLASIEIVDGLVREYSRINNIINKYEEDDYRDNYKIRAIKNTKLEIYREVLNNIKYLLEEHTNIDISKIEISDEHIIMPRMCDIDRNRVCNGCMDC